MTDNKQNQSPAAYKVFPVLTASGARTTISISSALVAAAFDILGENRTRHTIITAAADRATPEMTTRSKFICDKLLDAVQKKFRTLQAQLKLAA
jgi:hypothetical protein